jgi:hypothetical protein
MIDRVLKSPTTSKKWLASPDGSSIIEFLREWQASTVKALAAGKDPIEMYRAQGRLEVLNRILGLQAEITDYQDKVRTGKVQKIN